MRNAWHTRHLHHWAAGVVGIGMSVVGNVSTPAAEFPATAYSTSLASPPELVDPMSLVFRLPQRAARMESQVFTLYINSVGIVGATHGQSFFLLAQPETSGSMFQAGWGGSLLGFRLGAAGRAGRRRDESFRLSTRAPALDAGFDGEERTVYEGSAGIGFGSERLELDVAVDAVRLDAKETFLSLRAYQPYADTTAVYLESDDNWNFGGSAYARSQLGDVLVTAAGFWNRLESTYAGFEYVNSDLTLVEFEHALERWSAGLSIGFPVGILDWFVVSGRWLRTESEQWVGSADLANLTNRDQGTLSFALRQNLWRELWGQAGIIVDYTKSGYRSDEFDSQGGRRSYERNYESLGQQFFWGASYAWRNVDLHAAVRDNFPLGNLIFSLDVIARP